MPSTKSSILGISLGTRMVGVAVLCQGELVEWKVISFKGKWNIEKQNEIIDSIIEMLSEYTVLKIAMKKICPMRASLPLLQLERTFLDWCVRNYYRPKQFTIEQIRSFQENNSHKLEEELNYEYNRQQQINTPYYAKVFEAVTLAQMGNDASKMLHTKKS